MCRTIVGSSCICLPVMLYIPNALCALANMLATESDGQIGLTCRQNKNFVGDMSG